MPTTMSSCKMVHRAICHDIQCYILKRRKCLLSDWPPQSPDINAIENMWSILKTCVFQFNITSSDDLWNATLKAWNDIPIETIYTLYESIPRRLKAVVKAMGHHSKY